MSDAVIKTDASVAKILVRNGHVYGVGDDTAFTIGVRRKGPWNVDVSLTRGQNTFQFDVEDSVNASLGTASPTTFKSSASR